MPAATASDLRQFALAYTNNYSADLSDAPEYAEYVRFQICPRIKELTPGVEEIYYQDFSKAWIGHPRGIFEWELLPLADFERLLWVFNQARPRWSPSSLTIAGTHGRVTACYQNARDGDFELTGSVLNEPRAMGGREGSYAKNVQVPLAKMGLHKRGYEALATQTWWNDQIEAGETFEYGSSDFAPPSRKDFLMGTGEQE